MSTAALFVPIAHFGHVLIDAPIFFGPVFVLTGTTRSSARAPPSISASACEIVGE
jgi:hypothetical protein